VQSFKYVISFKTEITPKLHFANFGVISYILPNISFTTSLSACDNAPFIMPADIIALKRLSSWKEYIPGDFICVVVTSEYKVLRKVSVTQPDEQSINFTQMVDGTPVESSIPKDIIVEIYKVVGNYRRQ